MQNVGMTPLHIAIGSAIIAVGLIASVGRWAWVSPRFEGWFTKRFPRLAKVLITPKEERWIP
jgi:hypothetical protein